MIKQSCSLYRVFANLEQSNAEALLPLADVVTLCSNEDAENVENEDPDWYPIKGQDRVDVNAQVFFGHFINANRACTTATMT